MTHFGEIPESAGDFTQQKIASYFCGKCKDSTPHLVQLWESKDGAYEDYKYTCQTCGKICWVDGIDS